MSKYLPPIPQSWSELSWQQLTDCWQVKMRYGGNADVARAAALLAICGCTVCSGTATLDPQTGEPIYLLRYRDGQLLSTNPRQLSHLARQTMPWFDFPYGDPGEPPVKDEKGKVLKEGREPIAGYVGPMRDALQLPEETVIVGGHVFALPQVACNNLTWQQYRSLQALEPQLFQDGLSDDEVLSLQAQFMAHVTVPESETANTDDAFRPPHTFHYDADRAETAVAFWRIQLPDAPTLFHICFQVFHTALQYYGRAYPLLFTGDSKSQEFRDALQGEVGTVNTVMKYAGYAEQQQVYDSNLPFVLDILNTMTKEAKEIEKMNAKIKRKG